MVSIRLPVFVLQDLYALQFAVLHQLVSSHVQVHGQDPLTVLAFPIEHRFDVGADENVLPFALPQLPFVPFCEELE